MYDIFHAEEQCHANAEIEQMKRLNMLEDGTPKPNKNYARSLNGSTPMLMICLFYILGAVIPMLEVTLDGVLFYICP